MTKAQWRNKFHRDNDWKKSEENFIKKNYKTKTDKQIAKFLGRTEQAVQDRRLGLKIKKASTHPRFWTPEETKILVSKYSNHTAKQIANDFLPNKTLEKIKDKAYRLRLCKSKWTDEELDSLVKHGGKISSFEFAKRILRNKTPQQIRGKLKGLGISRWEFQRDQARIRDREIRKTRWKRKPKPTLIKR